MTDTNIKNLPEGKFGLHYVASFAGPMPDIEPGGRIRARVFATAIGADASSTCAIDADNDGIVDAAVKTHRVRATVRVPTTTLALLP